MLNLMANMAGSVLGAGAYPLPPTAMADVGLSFLSSGNRRYAFRSFCLILTVLNLFRSEWRKVLHGDISPGRPDSSFPPSQIGRSISLSQMQSLVAQNHT